MAVTWLKRFWPAAHPGDELSVAEDADALMRIWGDGAYAAAADLSWREDYGLLQTAAAGHWWRVTDEIGRRIGKVDDPRSLMVHGRANADTRSEDQSTALEQAA